MKWFAFICLTFFSALSYSANNVGYTIHHLYQSPRALGMGDAFVAIANDSAAMYYNPAALTTIEDSHFNLGILMAGSSPKALDFYNSMNDIQNSSASDSTKQDQLIDLIAANYGQIYTIRAQVLENIYAAPNWSVGFIPADISIEAALHQQIGPAINTTWYGDSSLTAGYSGNFNADFSWGISAKFINRAFYSQSVAATELAVNEDIVSRKDLSEGYTFDTDFGVLWRPRWDRWQWSFAAVGRNLLNLGFKNNLGLINADSPSYPEPLYRTLDIGASVELPATIPMPLRFALDIRDINHPFFNAKKGLHAGAEMDVTTLHYLKFQIRGGAGETFWSVGASLLLGYINFDFASYSQNVGTYNTSEDSRVYLIKTSAVF
jgi:hypothetical protein